MSPGITDVDETGAGDANLGSMIDEQALDNAQPVRQTDHPFGRFCEATLQALGLPNSQSAREVISAVCGHVARLTVIDEDEIGPQAEHIAKMIAKDREAQGDPQLWTGPAKTIAEHVLKLRAEGKAPVAGEAKEIEAVAA
jgi:hypothetical protein